MQYSLSKFFENKINCQGKNYDEGPPTLQELGRVFLNPLLRNVVKWSDTLSKSCSKCCKIFKVCLTILRHCEVNS